jgi:signal transduction histidine kinase
VNRTAGPSGVDTGFLADLSHELRTPLSGIIGFAELMHDGKLGALSPDHREYLGDILASARQLQRMLNELMDLAKVEAGTLEFRPQPVDLTDAVRYVCDVLGALATQRSIQVTTSIDQALGGVAADPARLEQLLRTALTGALKVTPQGGKVAIRLTPAGQNDFRIEVEDSSTSGAPRQSGLSAALSRGIVEAQGGEIGVKTAPGRGSVFYAVLPRTGRRGG